MLQKRRGVLDVLARQTREAYFVAWLPLLLAIAEPCLAELQIAQVAEGVYCGAPPQTAADYQLLMRYRIKTVVDLRKYMPLATNTERQRFAEMGIRFRSVPVDFFPDRDKNIEKAVAMMSDPALRPIYVHCNLGRDRAGLAIGLFRVRRQGWSVASALAEFKQVRFNPMLFGLSRYLRNEAGEPTTLERSTSDEPVVAQRAPDDIDAPPRPWGR
jgi:protein-tyrosine phosphatase